MDYILLKIFLSAEKFSKYFSAIDTSFIKDNNKEVYRLLMVLKGLHEEQLKDYSLEELELSLHIQYPYLKEDERVLYSALFEKISSLEVDEEKSLEYLEKQRQRAVSSRIAAEAVEVALGKKEADTLHSLMEELSLPIEVETEDYFVAGDLETLYGEKSNEGSLYWRLNTLNKIFGPIKKGDFGFLFARPETGKTTFLASEITHFSEQLPEESGPIIWFNNEESGIKVLRRCHQAALGLTKEEFNSNAEENLHEYVKRTKDKIKIVDDAGITKSKVERICAKFNPSLIVFDQIDKIGGFVGDRHDLMLKAIYQWSRELSKKYGPVVGVCQAGGTAEGKKYLNMNDVDGSHTAKQGEADWVLGIGATNNEGEEFMRYLSACKNKLDGDGIIEELRHGKMSVLIIPTIGRYEDVMSWE